MSTTEYGSIKQLPIGTYNFANSTKWIFNIPIGALFNFKSDRVQDGQLLDYPLNCQSVTFPQFRIGTTKLSFLNYGFDISNHSNQTQKTLNVKFLISQNWLQYMMLLKWLQLSDFTRYTKTRDQLMKVDIGNGIQQWINSKDYQKWLSDSGQYPYYSTQGPIVDSTIFLMDNFMNRICTFYFTGCFLTNIDHASIDYNKTDGTQISVSFTMKFYKYSVIVNDQNLKQYLNASNINQGSNDNVSVN